MTLPDGYSEADVLRTFDAIANQLSIFFTFGYYDVEDIKQEIRYECIKALPRFESLRGNTLYTFLLTHCKNRMNNLRRDKYFRYTQPCTCCDAETPEYLQCKRYKRWLATNYAKRNLVDSYASAEHSEPDTRCEEPSDEVSHGETLRIIDIKLPVEFRGDYRRYMEGGKLPKRRLISLLAVLRTILESNT